MKNVNLIGVTGKIGAGKDTVAHYLARYGYLQCAFADPLKEAASVMFGIPIAEFYDRILKEQIHPFWKITRREMLQKLGTECARRVFCDDFWIKRANITTDNLIERNYSPDVSSLHIIITDVRFDNEADWVRDQGGLIVHVIRPASDGISVSENYDSSTHASEAGVCILSQDLVLTNNKTLADFRTTIELLHSKGIL